MAFIDVSGDEDLSALSGGLVDVVSGSRTSILLDVVGSGMPFDKGYTLSMQQMGRLTRRQSIERLGESFWLVQDTLILRQPMNPFSGLIRLKYIRKINITYESQS